MAIQKGPSGALGTSIEAGEIATGAVTADKLGTGAVTADKLGTGAVTAGKVASGVITPTAVVTRLIPALGLYHYLREQPPNDLFRL